jgi:atypical dual specificity phosphatase
MIATVARRLCVTSFRWLIHGQLAGMARPGQVFDERGDLAALLAMGVRRLVSLEPIASDASLLAAHGMVGGHLPIAALEAPAIDRAFATICDTEAALQHGLPTAYACKGGIGRTGTLLAAHLIVRGRAPLHALEEVRAIHPRYVHSLVQEQFLDRLASWLRDRN